MITPAQCLEARKLLGWSTERLASRCGMSAGTFRKFEAGTHPLCPERRAAVQRAFEEQGIEFTNGGEPGVKLEDQGMR